jgi:hypothetical protein
VENRAKKVLPEKPLHPNCEYFLKKLAPTNRVRVAQLTRVVHLEALPEHQADRIHDEFGPQAGVGAC